MNTPSWSCQRHQSHDHSFDHGGHRLWTAELRHGVTASAHACSMGGSQIWLRENEQMSVSDMLKAVCVVSANDCAVALAEAVAGSEEASWSG